jgi:hypothetical protein
MTIPLVPLLRSACAARRAAWLVAVVGGGLVFVGTRGLAQEAVSRIAPFPRPQVAGIEGYIQTQNGYFLSAVQGGGVGGPDSGKGLTALHTDASKASSWEFFTLVVLDATHFALKTADGHFVTAVNGGGIGSTPGAQQPIVTNASVPAGSELVFRIQHTPSGTVTIKTSSGRFLTAVNAGGFGGPADSTAALGYRDRRRADGELFVGRGMGVLLLRQRTLLSMPCRSLIISSAADPR